MSDYLINEAAVETSFQTDTSGEESNLEAFDENPSQCQPSTSSTCHQRSTRWPLPQTFKTLTHSIPTSHLQASSTESVYVITDSESDDNKTPTKERRRPPEKRYIKVCPVEGCRAGPQKRLWNHFQYSHPEIKGERRHQLIKRARIVPKSTAIPKVTGRRLKGQATLESLFAKHTTQQSPVTTVLQPLPTSRTGLSESSTPSTSTGTRSYPRYDVDKHENFISFREWLECVEGKSRSQKVAREIAIDVSKYLKFACGEQENPDWSVLLDKNNVIKFVTRLEESGCGPEGRLTKLDNLHTAVRFLRLSVLDDNPKNGPDWYQKTLRIEDILTMFKRTLCRFKKKEGGAAS